VIAEVFKKKTQATPKDVIEACQRRLRRYDDIVGGRE
jgi:phage-related protein